MLCCRWSLYANMAIMVAVWTCQILMWLFQVWMVDVKCLVQYKACSSAARATHSKVLALPPALLIRAIQDESLGLCNGRHPARHKCTRAL